MIVAVAAMIILLQEPDVGVVADVAEARAAELGRNKVSRDQAGRIAMAARDASRRHRIPVAVILAVIETESAYGVAELSSAKCVGLMQLNPRTAKAKARELGMRRYHLRDIEDGIEIGTAYLREMWNRYHRLDHALSAYNRGPGLFERQRKPVGQYARSVLRRLPMLNARLKPSPVLAVLGP